MPGRMTVAISWRPLSSCWLCGDFRKHSLEEVDLVGLRLRVEIDVEVAVWVRLELTQRCSLRNPDRGPGRGSRVIGADADQQWHRDLAGLRDRAVEPESQN